MLGFIEVMCLRVVMCRGEDFIENEMCLMFCDGCNVMIDLMVINL